jgi:hypothetical protein
MQGETEMSYRVHRFDLRMTRDQDNLERFLNSLEGDVVAVIPNVTMGFWWVPRVDFVLVVERLGTRHERAAEAEGYQGLGWVGKAPDQANASRAEPFAAAEVWRSK